MDPARRRVRPACPEQRPRVAPKLPRHGKRGQPLPEDGDETEVGVVDGLERPVERPAQRLEQPELVEAPEAGRRQPAELAEDPLSCGPIDERRGSPRERLGPLVHPEPELVLEPDGAQEAQRVGDEDVVRDRPHDARVEVLQTAERIARLAARDRHRDRVEREVPRREVGVDAVGRAA